MTSEERTVRHYLQLAHDRGGGWQMAMRMMAGELAYAYEGRRGPDAEPLSGVAKASSKTQASVKEASSKRSSALKRLADR